SGHITLDFTEAVITQPALHIDADVRSGHITLIIKPGIVVDADDVTVRSGHVRVRAPWGTDVPVLLRINIAGACGSGHITARPPRRTFLQWLRRAPRRYAIAVLAGGLLSPGANPRDPPAHGGLPVPHSPWPHSPAGTARPPGDDAEDREQEEAGQRVG